MRDYLQVDLTMFSDEGATATESVPQQSSTSVNAPRTSRQESPLAKVQYGKVDSETPNAQGAATPTAGNVENISPEDRKAQYKEFKEKYKDIYNEDVSAIIKDRVKKYGTMEQQFGQYAPIINMLMEKHGTKDVNVLYETLQNDVYESIADRDGLSVEQVKQIETLKAENERLRQKTSTIDQETQMNQRIADWQTQGNNLKAEYPDFNIDSWAENKQFMDLLFAGVSVKAAYEVCDLSGIKANVAKQMEKNVVTNLQSKGKTVKENGTNPSPAITIKSSVKDLTKEDRKEIARRARMGETITF